MGILLTFHDASVTDAALKLQWNNESLNSGVVMVVDTFTGSDNGGFDAYKGSKAELKASGKKATGDDGYTWYEYTGTVTLTGDATQVAAWLYMWAGYNPDGTAPASDNENIYIDSLRLTPLGSADTVDYVSVFAAAGVVALVGTTVAVKIRKKEE